MLRAWFYLLGAVGALWLILYSFTFAPSYQECHEGYEKTYADPEKAHSQPEVFREFSERAMAFAWCQGEFAHANEGVITGFATAVIACFTITLWLIAWKQLGHAHEVDRAYLTAGGDIIDDGVGGKVFRFEIENIGRTAAFTSDYFVQFATWTEVKEKCVAAPIATIDDRLGPAGSTHSSFKRIRTSVPMKPGSDVVYGAIWYRDIWRKRHYSRFILSVDPAAGRTLPDVEYTRAHASYRRWT